MLFVAFEGLKGAGRKTQISLLADRLKAEGFSVANIAFPNFETEIARVTKRGTFDAYTLSLLYAADRSQYQERIKALLQAGNIVIADRYCYSNFAYQSSHGLPLSWLMEIERHVIKPDIVFLIDVPFDVTISRIQQSSIEDFTKKEMLSRLQAEREFLEKVREAYLHLARTDKEARWFVIDGLQSTPDVQKQIWQVVAKELKLE